MEHGAEVKYRNRAKYLEDKLEEIKSVLEKLRKKSEEEIQFGEALFEQGDRANGHFREGLGRGVLFAINRIEERL